MMHFNLKKMMFSALFAAAFLMLPGCGYHIGAGSMMHPQIRSIAVADVKNDTLEPLASQVMRMQLTSQIQTDGGLILKNIGDSDCTLYAKITDVKNQKIRDTSIDGDVTFRPSEFRLTVTVEFTVLIPGSGTPLIDRRTVTGSADYQILSDPNVSRATGLKYACYQASQMVVQYITEAW